MPKSYGEQNGKNPTRKDASKLARLQGLKSGKAEMPDWKRMPAELIAAVIAEWTQEDGAVQFGYSRDGGAYSLTIYTDGDRQKFYYHSDEEMWDCLRQLLGGDDV